MTAQEIKGWCPGAYRPMESGDGLIVAAGITLAFQPVHRAATRLTDRMMPWVDDSEAYRSERGREVYRGAVEAALMDGTVTDRERAILLQLQGSLGIRTTEADEIERAATEALS